MNALRSIRFLLVASIIATLALVGGSGAVSAHSEGNPVGTLDCQGNFTIKGTGDWYGGVTLDLYMPSGGDVVQSKATNPNSNQTDYVFTGTASAGDTWKVKPSDQRSGTTGTFEAPTDCFVPERSGSISFKQDCSYGTRVTYTYTTNVPEDEWVFAATGRADVNGTGDVSKTVNVGRAAGVASISFGERTKSVEYPAQAKCPTVIVHKVRVQWYGPCGDPMHGNRVTNLGNVAEKVTFRFNKFGVGWVTKTYVVQPGKSHWTGWKHVTGDTLMTVKAAGKTFTKMSAAPRNYRACWTP